MKCILKVLMTIFVRPWYWLFFFLSGKGPIANECVDAQVVDFSGQGRDQYGKGGDN